LVVNSKNFSLDSFLDNQSFFLNEAKKNKVFIYPTDSIYGIGMRYSVENMKKINKIKQRDEWKMCSVIVPSLEWIIKKFPNTNQTQIENFMKKYSTTTFILDYNFPGIRLINHPFQKFVKKLNVPFITTSINLTKQDNVNAPNETPENIMRQVDYIIDDWVLHGTPSVLIDMIKNKIILR